MRTIHLPDPVAACPERTGIVTALLRQRESAGIFLEKRVCILDGGRNDGGFPLQRVYHKTVVGNREGRFQPDPASGEITETGIIAGIPEYDGIIVSQPFSPLVPGVDQQAADPPVLPDWKNGQRCQRQLHRIACPDFGKKNMSRDLAVHFGDQRQFFDDGTAFSQPPDKIRFVAIGMFRVSESLTDDIKDAR